MRSIYFVIFFALACQPKNIIKSFDELVEKEEKGKFIYYDKQNNHFTGRIENENISGDFLNGKRIGLWRWYHKQGDLKAKGEYNKKGYKTGLWLIYDNRGKLTGESIYEEGKLIQGEDIKI